MAGGRDIFEVEGILDQRMRRGRTEYLIRWMGFDEDEDTWEPEKNLIGCEEILEQWKTRWLAAQTPRRSKIVKPIFKPPPTPPSSRRKTTKVVQKVETKTETPRRTPRSTPKAKITPTPKIKVTTVNDSEEETSVVVKVAQAATSNSAARAEQREEAVKVAENIAAKTVTATVEKQKVVQKVAAEEPAIAETTPSRKVRVTTVISSDNESDHELKRSALPSRDLSRQVYSQTRTTSSVTRSGVTESSVTSRSGVAESSVTSRSGVTERSGVMTRAAVAHEGTPVSTKLTRQPLDSVRDGRVGLFAEARSKVAVRMGRVQRSLTCSNLLNLVFVACMGVVFYTIFFIRK